MPTTTDYCLRLQDGNEISARTLLNTNKRRRLQNLNQQPLLLIAFSIICALTIIIVFGSNFFVKLTVNDENLPSELASIETQITAMEVRINELIDEKIEKLSSELTNVTKTPMKAIDEKIENMKLTIEEVMDVKIRASENITITLRNLTDEVRSSYQGFQNQISQLEKNISGFQNQILQLAKNISGTVEWLHDITEEDIAYKIKMDERIKRLKKAY